MGTHFPLNQINYLFENATMPSSSSTGFAGGQNGWTSIVSKPEKDDDSFPAERSFRHFVHETSHYYWRGNVRWINEGAATFFEAVAENSATGRPLSLERGPCTHARNIADLENLDPEHINPAARCYYQFGERIFHDLYRNMDETTFRLGFRRLYMLSQFDDPEDDCEGTKLNVCHVRTAFRTEVPEETAATVENVINRWYDGSEPYDLSRTVDIPVDPALPQIGGRIEKAYLTTGDDERTVSQLPASDDLDRLLITLRFSHRSHSSFRVPIEIVEVYEDGFVYGRQIKTLTVGDYGKETAWVSRPRDRAVGRHWVVVYNGKRKVAQVEYEVTP